MPKDFSSIEESVSYLNDLKFDELTLDELNNHINNLNIFGDAEGIVENEQLYEKMTELQIKMRQVRDAKLKAAQAGKTREDDEAPEDEASLSAQEEQVVKASPPTQEAPVVGASPSVQEEQVDEAPLSPQEEQILKRIEAITEFAEKNSFYDSQKDEFIDDSAGNSEEITLKDLNNFWNNRVNEYNYKHKVKNEIYTLAEIDAIQDLGMDSSWDELNEEEKKKKLKEAIKEKIENYTTEAIILQERIASGNRAARNAVNNPKQADDVINRWGGKEPSNDETKRAFDIIKSDKRYTITDGVLVTTKVVNYANITSKFSNFSDNFQKKIAETKLGKKITSFNNNMTKRYPNLWPALRNAALGYAKVQAIGLLTGPVGLAVYAGYNVHKQVKSMRQSAKMSGKSFWSYAKDHPWQASMMGLSAFSATLGSISGLGVLGSGQALGYIGKGFNSLIELDGVQNVASNIGSYVQNRINLQSTNLTRSVASIGQGLAQAFRSGVEHYKDTGNVWGAIKVGGSQGIGTAIAVFTTLSHGVNADAGSNSPSQDTASQTEINNPFNGSNPFIQQPTGPAPDNYVESPQGTAVLEEMGPPAPPYDLANETQIERLFDVNAKAVNGILGGEWKNSDTLAKMMDNGGFTEEQLKEIHNLANNCFDEKGNIIDGGLEKYYEDLAAAKEKQTSAETPRSKIEPLADIKDPEVKVESSAEKPDPIAEKHQQMMAENQANNNLGITKIQLVNSETGEYKVVGEINGGDKFTLDTTHISLNDMGESNTDVNNVKFNDDGSMSLKGVSEGGRDFSMKFDKDGNITQLSVEGKNVSDATLESMNKTGIYKDLYEGLNQVKETDGWSIDKNNPKYQDGQDEKGGEDGQGASATPPAAPEIDLNVEIKEDTVDDALLDVDDKELKLETKSGKELAEELEVELMEVPSDGGATPPAAPEIDLNVEIEGDPIVITDEDLNPSVESEELEVELMKVPSNKGATPPAGDPETPASKAENASSETPEGKVNVEPPTQGGQDGQGASVDETIYAPKKWVNSSKGAILTQCSDLDDDAYYNRETQQGEIISPYTNKVISTFTATQEQASNSDALNHIRDELIGNLWYDEEKYCNLPQDNLTEEQIEFKAKHDEMMANIGLTRNEEGKLVKLSADTHEAPEVENVEKQTGKISEGTEETGHEAKGNESKVYKGNGVEVTKIGGRFVAKCDPDNEVVDDIKQEFKLDKKDDGTHVYKTSDGAVIAQSENRAAVDKIFDHETRKLATSEQAYREISQIPKENRTEIQNEFMKDHEQKLAKYGLERNEDSNNQGKSAADIIQAKRGITPKGASGNGSHSSTPTNGELSVDMLKQHIGGNSNN